MRRDDEDMLDALKEALTGKKIDRRTRLKNSIVKSFRELLEENGIVAPAVDPTFQIKRNKQGQIRLEVTFP